MQEIQPDIQPDICIVIHEISSLLKQNDAVFEARLIQWCITSVIVSGISEKAITTLLSCSQSQWWAIRQLMSESAIRALHKKVKVIEVKDGSKI